MSDANKDTGDNKDVDQTAKAVTDPEVKTPASPKVNEEDLKNVVSQRDANFEKAKSLEQRLDVIEAEKARDEFISKFLKDNKDYGFVDAEDLISGTSEEEIEEIAKRVQSKAEKVRQSVQDEYNKVPEPVMLTGKDKNQKLESLKKQAEEGKDVFGEMLAVEGIL